MSQESFVLVKDLNFNDAGIQAKSGDVLVFTPPEKLVIYRAGDIIGRIGFHRVSIDGLVLSGILLTEKKAKAQGAPKPVKTPEVTTTIKLDGGAPDTAPTGNLTAPELSQTPNDPETTPGAPAPEPEAPETDEAPTTTGVVEEPKAEPKVEKPAAKPAKATEPAKKTTKK